MGLKEYKLRMAKEGKFIYISHIEANYGFRLPFFHTLSFLDFVPPPSTFSLLLVFFSCLIFKLVFFCANGIGQAIPVIGVYYGSMNTTFFWNDMWF